MPSRPPLGAVALTAVLGVAAALPAAGELYTWQGVVRDGDGRPMAGARVVLSPLDGPYAGARRWLLGEEAPGTETATTGADGSWSVATPAGAARRLCIAAPGFAPFDAVGVAHPAFLDAGRVELDVDRGPAVRVVDADGRPVAGARVLVARYREPFRPPPPGCPFTTTGDDGVARLSEADAVSTRLLALPPAGRADLLPSHPVEVRGPAATLVLPAGVPREVHVRLPGGEPAAGALVEHLPGVPLALADETGRVTVAAPASGPAAERRLLAAGGFHGRLELAPGSRRAAADGTPPPPLRVTLAPPEVHSGRVLALPDRQPVAGATVVWSPELATASADDGSFAFAVPAAGRGGERAALGPALSAWAPGFTAAAAAAPAAPGAGLVLLLRPAAGVRGRVVDAEGNGVAGARVVAREDLRGRFVMATQWMDPLHHGGGVAATSGEDGAFTLRDLAPGRLLWLYADRAGFAPAAVAVPPLGDGEVAADLRLVLAPASTLTARVLGSAGQSVPGAAVRAVPSRALDGDAAAHPWLPCDADGTCRVTDLAAGRYDLQAAAPEHVARLVAAVPVEPAAGVDLGTLYLEPAVAVRGTVRGADGRPLAGAEVRGGREAMAVAVTGTDGRFAVGGLAAGDRVDLRVAAEGHVTAVLADVEAPASGLEVALAAAATVSGVVEDAAGRPQAGVVLGIEEVPEVPRPAWANDAHGVETREDGTFRRGGLAAGIVVLVPHDRGEPVSLRLAAGEHRDGVRIVVGEETSRRRLTGRVLDPGGAPVAGAVVELRSAEDAGVSVRLTTATAADGGFALTVPFVAPSFELRVDHPDYLRVRRRLDAGGGGEHVELVLQPGAATLAGRVLGDDGAPRPGANVWLLPVDEAGEPFGVELSVSGGDGRFRFTGVEPGRYRLRAAAEGWLSGESAELAVAAGEAGPEVELRLSRGTTVHGRVPGVAEAYGGDLRVGLRSQRPHDSARHQRVSYDGGFRFAGVAPGDYVLSAFAPGDGVIASAEVTVPADAEEVEVDLRLDSGHRVQGELRVNGSPFAGAALALAGDDDEVVTRSGHAGGFRFRRVPAGRYRLRVTDLGYKQALEVHADRELRLDVPAAELAGSVVGPSGAPVGARVELVPESAPEDRLEPEVQSFGHFRFRVPAGAYRLLVTRGGRALADLPLTLALGSRIDGLEVRVDPAAAAEEPEAP